MSQMLGQSGERRHSGPYATNPALLLVSKQFIDGALDLYRVPTRHVRVQHRRLDLAVPEQPLDVAKIRSPLEEVGGERVPERVGSDPFADPSAGGGRRHLPVFPA